MSIDGMPALSVVVPWHNRAELATTLERNLAVTGADVEFVVSASGRVDQAHRVVGAVDGRGRARVVATAMAVFNKSRLLNVGVAAARADTVLLLDTDVLLDPGTLPEMRRALTPTTVVTVERVREHDRAAPERPGALRSFARFIEVVDARGRRALVATNRIHLDEGSRAGPGLVMVARARFLAVGGMNGALVGWGWEDVDLLVRLLLVEGLERVERGCVEHLTHGDDVRALHGQSVEDSETDNFGRATRSYLAGDFLGTFDADVAAIDPPGAATVPSGAGA